MRIKITDHRLEQLLIRGICNTVIKARYRVSPSRIARVRREFKATTGINPKQTMLDKRDSVRETRGMTTVEAGKRLGVHQATVSKWRIQCRSETVFDFLVRKW